MFPGASSVPPDDAAYGIHGAPLDRSTSFVPGTRFGPAEVRRAAQGFEDYDHATDQSFSQLSVSDFGDLHAWSDAEEYLSFLAGELSDIAGIPILLGGEHTVSVAGVRATEPDLFVTVDAHLDLRSSLDGDPWSHATVSHHVREAGIDVTILGARAGAADEWERAETDPHVRVVPVDSVSAWLAETELSDRDVYLSVDIDGVDPAFAPATGTREPFGLSAETVRDVVRQLAPGALGFDVVEVNDRDDGQTATLAAKLVRRFIFDHAAVHT